MSLFDDLPRRPRRSSRGGARRGQGRARGAPAQPPPGVAGDLGEGQPGDAGRSPDAQVVSVGQLTSRIDAALKGFGRVSVEGEVSRPKTVASGHLFFTLKDDRAALDCKVWRTQIPRAIAGGMRLEDGARVVCHGTLDVYAPYGKHSLIVDRIEARGIGALLADLERLKAQLAQEGLFDRRRPLPAMPRVVGVVTSRDADAWRDFLRTRTLRWPGYAVRLVHSRVQGRGAAQELARAVARLDASGVDVIVVCRGGGSIEDLWCFNEEPVARAIFAASVPVVTGVGHETDTTLVDLVADHRAHTPTDAAQTVLPDRRALEQALERQAAHLGDAMERGLERRFERLGRLGSSRVLLRPDAIALDRGRRVEAAGARLLAAVQGRSGRGAASLEALATRLERQSPAARLARIEERLAALGPRLAAVIARGGDAAEARLAQATLGLGRSVASTAERAEQRMVPVERALAAVSPLAVLERGYSITRRADGSVLTDPSSVAPGERLTSIVHGGEIDSTAVESRPSEALVEDDRSSTGSNGETST